MCVERLDHLDASDAVFKSTAQATNALPYNLVLGLNEIVVCKAGTNNDWKRRETDDTWAHRVFTCMRIHGGAYARVTCAIGKQQHNTNSHKRQLVASKVPTERCVLCV